MWDLATDIDIAHSRAPWYRSRRFTRRQTSITARRRSRRVHIFRRLNKDVGEHTEGYFRGCGQYIWVLDTESLEGDQAE